MMVEMKYGQNTTRWRSTVYVSCTGPEAEGAAPEDGGVTGGLAVNKTHFKLTFTRS